MRKYGLIAAILGFGLLGLDFLLREKVNLSLWAWLAGAALSSGGAALFLVGRWASVPGPGIQQNEELRFLKKLDPEEDGE